MNLFAEWFASAFGMDMTGDSAGSRFATDRALLGPNESKSGRPSGGLFV
jgi:hypothetical protein